MSGMIAGSTMLLAGASGGGEYLATKKASEASEREARKARQATEAATEQARLDVNSLFPGAQASSMQGFQNAINTLRGVMPLQTGAFQQGNVGAQETILAGLPQIQNAILGNQVDLSGLQPRQLDFDASSFLAGIPNLQSQSDARARAASRIPAIFNAPPTTQPRDLAKFAVSQLVKNLRNRTQQGGPV